MAQFYSDETREEIETALPDCEVFHVAAGELVNEENEIQPAGWYYWFCFPGCLPDSDAIGPFASEQEAVEDARNN